jgi:hypothetical protein
MISTRAQGMCGLLLCLFSAAALVAQTPSAVINGTVTDPTGASVADARVTAINQDTNVASSRNTGNDGTFTIINLLPGNYTLSVEKAGFKRLGLPVFKLDVNQTLAENLRLEVGASTETVTVSADSVGLMVQRATTELGTTFDEHMVHELPLNGRNFTQLLILQPGINPVDTSQGNSSGKTGAGGNPDGGNISIPGSTVYKVSANGATNRSNAYYMDGIINTDDRGGGWAVPPIGFPELSQVNRTAELQFRAEAFNVFNHMVLAAPGTSIAPSFSNGAVSYGSAGVITNIANTPRSMQLALKFLF